MIDHRCSSYVHVWARGSGLTHLRGGRQDASRPGGRAGKRSVRTEAVAEVASRRNDRTAFVHWLIFRSHDFHRLFV